MADARIELRDVSPRGHEPHVPQPQPAPEPSYRAFLFSALGLALFGGLLFALLLALAGALEWDWGQRWQELVQAHGQLQLVGFAGLYIAGMALRLMPRFSGRALVYPRLALPLLIAIAAALVLRSAAVFVEQEWLHRVLFISGALLLFAGSLAFAAIIWRTLLGPGSRAEATAWFFILGSAMFVAQAVLQLWLAIGVDDGVDRLISVQDNNALITLQLYGFVMMFIGGIATRAIATLVGRPRSAVMAKAAAATLALGAAVSAGSSLWIEHVDASEGVFRTGNAAMLAIAGAFILVVWAAGVFQPGGNRVAAASQTQFQFARAGMAWLAIAAAVIAWYATPALLDGNLLDQFKIDATRHALTIGVITMLIVGMSMLVVPEFAGRRLQHPDERALILGLLVALNAAAVLRIWPAMEGTGWITSTRYWPMAVSASLTLAAVGAFAGMFVQSYAEQRDPGWASAEALARRKQ